MSSMAAISILPSLEKDTSKLRKFHTSKLGTKLYNNNYNNNLRYTLKHTTTDNIENREDMFKAYLRGERQTLEELAFKHRKHRKKRIKVRRLQTWKHGKHGNGDGSMPKPKKLIISEAARFLGVSYKTMDNYLKQGKLPYEWGQGPTGRARFVSMEALEAWKEGRPVPSLEGKYGSMESIENGSIESIEAKHGPSIESMESMESMESVEAGKVESAENTKAEYLEPVLEPSLKQTQPQQQIMPVIDVLQLTQLRQEMDNLRRENEEWRQELEQRLQENEKRFEQWVKERDYKLVETMRKMMEIQKREWEEEKKNNRPWWRRLFGV